MPNQQGRDIGYWAKRLREDGPRLKQESKLNVVRASLVHTTHLSKDEIDLFLSPKESLSNPENLMQYAIIERKVADIFSGGFPENWENRINYLADLRMALVGFYTQPEIDELQAHIKTDRDVTCLTAWLAGDHYGFRRIRNAYLPEITDLISVDLKTGQGRDVTNELFVEDGEDAVSKIERILG